MSHNLRATKLMLLIGLLVALTACGLIPGTGSGDEVEQQLEQLDLNQIELVIQTEQLEQKFEQAEPDQDGNLRITFTEEEVNQAVVIRRDDVPEDQATDLQNAFLRFEDNEVLLDGTVSGLLQGELEVRFTPEVEDGALQLELSEARLGRVNVPQQFLGGLESALNTSLGALLRNLPTTYNLREVDVVDGALTLVAQPNEANQ